MASPVCSGVRPALLKIGVSGIRGVVGDFLTPGLACAFAQAFGTYVGPGRVVVGRDTRASGEMLYHAAACGLLAAGCDLAVYNRSAAKADPLVRLGAKPAGSAAELAARDIVFVTVGTSDDLTAAVLGPLLFQNAAMGALPTLRAATDLPLAAGFELERSLYGALTLTQDRQECRKAFREKRKPNFQGK